LRLSKEAAIVDVGCGGGELLRRLKFLGFENVSGINPFFKGSGRADQSLVLPPMQNRSITLTKFMMLLSRIM